MSVKSNLKTNLYSSVSSLTAGAALAIVAMLTAPQIAYAQYSLRDILSQDEVVVTATRRFLAVATLWQFSNYGAPRYFNVEVGAKFRFGNR